jgi:hypothetical protein
MNFEIMLMQSLLYCLLFSKVLPEIMQGRADKTRQGITARWFLLPYLAGAGEWSTRENRVGHLLLEAIFSFVAKLYLGTKMVAKLSLAGTGVPRLSLGTRKIIFIVLHVLFHPPSFCLPGPSPSSFLENSFSQG